MSLITNKKGLSGAFRQTFLVLDQIIQDSVQELSTADADCNKHKPSVV